jgi:hypothetical protein
MITLIGSVGGALNINVEMSEIIGVGFDFYSGNF